jgi:hypothetical protein
METQVMIGKKRISIKHPDGTVLQRTGKTLIAVPKRPPSIILRKDLEKEGIQWGDAIKWATDKLGIKQCARCRQDQAILNQARQLGLAETIRQIKETFRGSR